MTRLLLGLGLGIVLVFPGIELLRWLAVQVVGVYDDMTLTEACLGMIVILQSIILTRGVRRRSAGDYPARMAMVGSQVKLRPQPRTRRRPSARSGEARTRSTDRGGTQTSTESRSKRSRKKPRDRKPR